MFSPSQSVQFGTRVESLEAAYDVCREITREHARTFYLASYFLRRRKRNACYAVYALCRYVDDLVDESVDPEDPQSRRRIEGRIASLREEIERSGGNDEFGHPVLLAWSDAVDRYDIDRRLPEALIDGCLADLRPTVEIQTYEELYDYCYKVASVVGLMTAPIFGFGDQRARRYAVELGIAMQLTNIIRDVAEDFERGRIYLPADEMRRFDVRPEDLGEKVASPELRRLIAFQIRRARAYYRSAERGIGMLERDGRIAVMLMRRNYAAILDEIDRRDYDVLAGRAWVSLGRKLLSLPKAIVATIPPARMPDEKPSD